MTSTDQFTSHCDCWDNGDPCCWCGDDTEDVPENQPLPKCRPGVKGECSSFNLDDAEATSLRAEVARLRASCAQYRSNFQRAIELLEGQLRLHATDGDEADAIRQWLADLERDGST